MSQFINTIFFVLNLILIFMPDKADITLQMQFGKIWLELYKKKYMYEKDGDSLCVHGGYVIGFGIKSGCLAEARPGKYQDTSWALILGLFTAFVWDKIGEGWKFENKLSTSQWQLVSYYPTLPARLLLNIKHMS